MNDEKRAKAEVVAGADEHERPTSWGGWLWEQVLSWGPVILAVLVIRTFIFEPFRIPSGSMIPTLLVGDHVIVTKSSYGVWLPFVGKELVDLGDPARGDIIVFRYPLEPSKNYIKRVVGIPGDRVRVDNNRIWINGVEQVTSSIGNYEFPSDDCNTMSARHFRENLGGVDHSILTGGGMGGLEDMHEKLVPDGSVFVMGDNRDNSMDSRQWGWVRFDQIKGKAHRIWLSWDGCNGRIRTERFGQTLYAAP